ncbi:MAG: HD domain-containing protein [Bdellovibrionales bacterium]|nr:HD domain-containing protein [Bdellovibrionales bacterium]
MRILDPVHKYITFSDQEALLVDSALFQRLRYIRQLGFAEFAFPGAVHNRFLHSIGVCHLAGRAFDSLLFLDGFLSPKKKKDFRQLVRLAALLHDVGHGPLSHISEVAMPPLKNLSLSSFSAQDEDGQAAHEHYTIKIILESEIGDIIKNMGIDPLYVAHLIDDRIQLVDSDFFISKGVDFKPLLKQIVSSDLDMDRMDYLQRDAFFCGTDYGFCDHEWILQNMRVHINKDKAFMGIGQKAVYSMESFFLGRRHMGLAIYFHNKMVAMDQMLYHYFLSDNCDFRIPVSLEEYLYCTDISLFENLRGAACKNEWARRILEKKPYEKVYEVPYTGINKAEQIEKLEKVREVLKKKSIPFIHTKSSDHIEKHIVQKHNSFPIYVVNETTGQAVNLMERMRMFNQKEHIVLMDRIYVPPEVKSKVYFS